MSRTIPVEEYEANKMMDDMPIEHHYGEWDGPIEVVPEEVREQKKLQVQYADLAKAAVLALTPEERIALGMLVVETQIHARVGTNQRVRECHCRVICGGISQCNKCTHRQEAM